MLQELDSCFGGLCLVMIVVPIGFLIIFALASLGAYLDKEEGKKD